MYTLLIVDDEPLVRRGIKALVDFEKLSITQVIEAVNGQQALDICAVEKPDLILADINMPRLDGLTFAEHIKKESPHTRIALITGYDYFDYALQAIKIGVDDYILKPVSKNDVEEVLIKLIAKLEQDVHRHEVEKTVTRLLKDSVDESEDTLKLSIQKILDQELTNPKFSFKGLCEQLGYSSGYFSGVFKSLYGSPFQDYLLNQRLEKAKLLLLTTDMKNYQVAEAVGFSDVNYFGTRFKKRYGESPKQYKEKVGSHHETST